MSPLRAFLTLALASLASVVLSIFIASSAAEEGPEETDPSGTIGIQWDFQPDGLGDLASQAPAVVVAEVMAIEEGEPITFPSAEPFPSQLVDFDVVDSIEGEVPQAFTLFKIGDAVDYSAEDPPYEIGQQYLLFLRPRLNDASTAPNADGTFLSVAPDGRYEREEDGELEATVESSTTEELEGLTVPEAEVAIEEAVEEPAP